MHGFESVVAEILQVEGYWIQSGFKVVLNKSQKHEIGRPSSPRWEIDLLAYRAPTNEVLAVECKSYLDSSGVDLADLKGGRYAHRYKLFTEPNLRRVVLEQLREDLVGKKFCAPNPQITLALAAGRLKSDPAEMRNFFTENKWGLFDPDWVRDSLKQLADAGYTDSVAVMVSKILLRDNGDNPEKNRRSVGE